MLRLDRVGHCGWLGRAFAVALSVVSLPAPLPARAAEAPTLSLVAPALPLGCLTGAAPGALGYPVQVKTTDSAVLRIEMHFSSKDAGPKAVVRSNSGDPAFEPAVLAFVAAYRLPCLEAGQSVSTVQEFQFKGSNGESRQVLKSEARYAVAETLATHGCTVDGLSGQPRYPREALQTFSSGTVVIALKFEAADQEPEFSVVFDGGQEAFTRVARHVTEKYRLRCREPLTRSLTARQTFTFRIDGGSFPRLKEQLTLQQLLGGAEGLQKASVRFDLRTMACPFELTFYPYQPYADNVVDADVDHHPERREFVEWLRKIVTAIPTVTLRTAIGMKSTVAVPCALIDLT